MNEYNRARKPWCSYPKQKHKWEWIGADLFRRDHNRIRGFSIIFACARCGATTTTDVVPDDKTAELTIDEGGKS